MEAIIADIDEQFAAAAAAHPEFAGVQVAFLQNAHLRRATPSPTRTG